MDESRRAFIFRAFGLVGGYIAAVTTAIAGGSLIQPILPKKYNLSLWPLGAIPSTLRLQQPWTAIGPVSTIPDNKTTLMTVQAAVKDAWVAAKQPVSVYVKRSGNSLTVFDLHCTHLGCGVHWAAEAQRYFCPCHGSVFNASGDVVSGPAPFPLYQYATKIENGTLYIGNVDIRGAL